MPKNKMIAESGADMPDRMPNENNIPMQEDEIQSRMGFVMSENMHGKSKMMNLPEHPRKEM